MKHRTVACTPWVRCVTKMNAARSLQYDRSRSFCEMKLAKGPGHLHRTQLANMHLSHSSATTRQVIEDAEHAVRDGHYPRGHLFLNMTASKLKRVFQTCTASSALSHCTNTLLVFRKYKKIPSHIHLVHSCCSWLQNVSSQGSECPSDGYPKR